MREGLAEWDTEIEVTSTLLPRCLKTQRKPNIYIYIYKKTPLDFKKAETKIQNLD